MSLFFLGGYYISIALFARVCVFFVLFCIASVVRHLRSSAKRADYVVLWLDCDREGENICFEVIDAIRPSFGHGMDRIYRARFSALSVDEVSFALKFVLYLLLLICKISSV